MFTCHRYHSRNFQLARSPISSRAISYLLLACLIASFSLAAESLHAADDVKKTNASNAKPVKPAKRVKKKQPPFQWVNPLKNKGLAGVSHGTFKSPSMKLDVGYCIYLPPEYANAKSKTSRYPVVYYLHGGRPGNENKSVSLSSLVHAAIVKDDIKPTIYVFVNGGPVSHYNMPDRDNAMGEDVFIKELIPHIDKTYRTIANQRGRAIEGFSQGGRGTARIMFKHPHLFCSAAPGGGGYATEKRISEENGKESETLKFTPGYNTWDHARAYSKRQDANLKIQIHVGTRGFNYENNLEYMKFLESLNIPFKRVIAKDAPHSAKIIYQKRGKEIMQFHQSNFVR